MADGVFISYRRSDSAGFAGRIADYFAYRYPQVRVFFDAASIEPGDDFVESINTRLESSAVVLAPIGAAWLDARDPVSGQRRIDNPNDFVRRELSMALAQGARVVPVLLDNAQMPSASELPEDLAPLSRCNAELMRHAAFARDVEHLGVFVVGHLESGAAPTIPRPSERPPSSTSAAAREALAAAFDTFAAEWSSGDWMICEAPSGSFVQFVRESDDVVTLDLPVSQLDQAQLGAARRLILEDHAGEQAEDVALQVELPMESSYLAHMTLDVFDRVFGVRGAPLLKVTLEGNGVDPVRFQVDDEHARRTEGEVSPEVAGSLEAAFEAFCATPVSGFMICESSNGEFVQFARDVTDDFVTLDVPTQTLKPMQIVAAQHLLEDEHGARRGEQTDEGDFSYQLDLPPDPVGLTTMTLEVFGKVYGRRPTAPLTVTTGEW